MEPRGDRGRLGVGTPGAAGARFRGRNRSGPLRWSRPCAVVEADRPARFAFETDGGPVFRDCSRWTFELLEEGEGTRIVQRYEILSLPRWFEAIIVRLLPAHADRTAALQEDLVRLGRVAASAR